MRSDRALYADAGLTRLVDAGEADVVIASGPGKTIHPMLVAQLDLVTDAAGRVSQRGVDREGVAEPVPNPKPKPRRSAPPAEKDATRRRSAKRKR